MASAATISTVSAATPFLYRGGQARAQWNLRARTKIPAEKHTKIILFAITDGAKTDNSNPNVAKAKPTDSAGLKKRALDSLAF
jgi:hypothetical protein